MKKKMLMILLAAVMTMTAGACGNGKNNDGNTDTQTENENKDEKGENGDDAAKSEQVSYKIEECVTLGDYSGLKLSMPNDYKVTDEQVDDYAYSMAKYNAQPAYKDTNKKKVEEGDTVNIDYVGKKDGVAFDGGTAQGYNLTIGSNSFIDGFEEGLVGAKVGSTVDLDLSFPENYPSEDLAGAAVVFTVKVNKIVVEDPDKEFELTDEYVSQNYNVATVKEFKKNVKEYLLEQNKSSKEADTRQSVINELEQICKVTLPDELLDTRIEESIEQFKNKNLTDGTSLADFLAQNHNGMTEEQFRTDISEEVKTNLTTELILEALAKKEGIELEEEAFQDFVQQQMDAYAYATAEDFYKSNGADAKSGEAYQRKVFVCNRALDLVVDQAKIKYGVIPNDAD